MNKNKGKHILERDSIELSEEGYKRLIEAENENMRAVADLKPTGIGWER